MEEWIMQGAIIGLIIGAILQLTGDSLTNFIDSLINRSRTPPLTEDIPGSETKQSKSENEPDVSTEDIQKELREGIESVIPVEKWENQKREDDILEALQPVFPTKKWEREAREREEKQNKECNDLFQEWNNLCSWFGENSKSFLQQKIDADRMKRKIEHDVLDICRRYMDEQRSGLRIFKVFGYGAMVLGALGLVEPLVGAEAAGIAVEGLPLGAHVGEHFFWDPFEGEEARLDREEKEALRLLRQRLDEIDGPIRKLKEEYLKNRSRLHDIERSMRESNCEKIYSAVGHTGIPARCPYEQTGEWQEFLR